MPPQTQRHGKRQEHKAQTQTAILNAARELFHKHGYEQVTIRQISKAAGVSTGALFSSWPGKAGVFEAATGHPAPDVEAFLLKVAGCQCFAGSALAELATEAERLRRHLQGHHG